MTEPAPRHAAHVMTPDEFHAVLYRLGLSEQQFADEVSRLAREPVPLAVVQGWSQCPTTPPLVRAVLALMMKSQATLG